ncbi:SapC family protein [Methylotuvimicrobium sp. KM2]|uniref:SapC family protein n=1 Tax=Methylotuvimicrobium sp. KM2 TaxID=3133976 RepID=UPI00310104F2
MNRWQLLDPKAHSQAGWQKFTHYAFASQDVYCPILMAELTQTLPYYALAFIPVSPTEPVKFQLIALLGLRPNRNVYLDGHGKWLAPYVPSFFRGYPFSLLPDEHGKAALAVDITSPLLHNPAQPEDTLLYQESGELTEAAGQILNFLTQRLQNQQLTQALTDALQQAELIQPWTISWQPNSNDADPEKAKKQQNLGGFYQIDEQRLRSLSPETYQSLAKTSALGLAYAQLFSQARLQDLRYREHKARSDAQPAPSVDFDTLFGTKDDTLKFNF